MHHIIPRHAGGSDDPSNLKRVTIEEHAEEHRKLYEKYGDMNDYVAWQALSKGGMTPELISIATKAGIRHHVTSSGFSAKQSRSAKSMWRKEGMREHLIQKRREQSAAGKNPMQGKKQKRACCLRCKTEFPVNMLAKHQKSC